MKQEIFIRVSTESPEDKEQFVSSEILRLNQSDTENKLFEGKYNNRKEFQELMKKWFVFECLRIGNVKEWSFVNQQMVSSPEIKVIKDKR